MIVRQAHRQEKYWLLSKFLSIGWHAAWLNGLPKVQYPFHMVTPRMEMGRQKTKTIWGLPVSPFPYGDCPVTNPFPYSVHDHLGIEEKIPKWEYIPIWIHRFHMGITVWKMGGRQNPSWGLPISIWDHLGIIIHASWPPVSTSWVTGRRGFHSQTIHLIVWITGIPTQWSPKLLTYLC